MDGVDDTARRSGIALSVKSFRRTESGHQRDTAVAVLNVSSGHQCRQQQARCCNQDGTFLALDQLARIEVVRIDAIVPFSAPLPLWLSMMQAVELASRSACSRHSTKSTSWPS